MGKINSTLILILFSNLLYAQIPGAEYRKKKFTDVKCILYINYQNGLNSGNHFFTDYAITAGKTEFIVEGKQRNGMILQHKVPFTKEEIKKASTSASAKNDSVTDYRKLISSLQPDHYFSEKETYRVNDTTYTVYKHITYNCYDPFCGSKHGHITTETGEIYFSPDFGILIDITGELQVELLVSMKEKAVPHVLVTSILKAKGIDNKIIQQYIADTK